MTEGLRTIDRMVAAYSILAAAALAFPGRPPAWPLLLLGHAGLLALALAASRLARGGTGARILADWYPLLVMPLLYSELAILNVAVWQGRYFDPVILAAEAALFGGQPSASLARAAPWPLLSEPLHAAYLSYYFMIYLPPLYLYSRGRREDYQVMLGPLLATFFLHYLAFIYFPVQGPRYLFPAPGGEIAGWPMYDLAHRVLEAGSSRGAAFPSSHMAVAAAQTVAAFRLLPRLGPVMLLGTIGLGVGAVYGGFHYATDMIVGGVVGTGVAGAFVARDRRRPK